MYAYLRERAAYGRAVRDEAERLIVAQGVAALALAEGAASVEGDPELRRFRAAVARRVARAIGRQCGSCDVPDDEMPAAG